MSLDHQSDEFLRERRAELIGRSPWKANIFLPTEKIALEQQVSGLESVVDIYENRLFKKYSEELRSLKDRYKNCHRCFIIGNGPSLNETDLSQLEDEVTFCVNGFFLKMPELSWVPTFYVVEDHLVAEDRAQEINALNGPTKLFPAYLAYCLNEGPETIFFNHRGRVSYPEGFDFSTDASEVTYTGCTVTFTCMQIAHYLGFREIYLVGVDASYEIPEDVNQANAYGTGVLDMKSDDPNHFHPDYFGKGYRWHDPQVEKMIDAYSEARRITDSLNRPIFNATSGGKLEVFERRNFCDIFPSAIPASILRELKDGNHEDELESLEIQARFERRNTHTSSFPKVALIDMTPASGTTATGALKSTLFLGWPDDRLLQVHTKNRNQILVEGGTATSRGSPLSSSSASYASKLIAAFDADVILYRPLPERPILNRVFNEAIQRSAASTMIWVMDDWLGSLQFSKDPEFKNWNSNLTAFFESASVCLSISEAMSEEYKLRYGVDFVPISNAIEPSDWVRNTSNQKPYCLIRYSGNLSETMSLASVLHLAEAVEKLSEEYDLQFEIQTREHFGLLHSEKFQDFKNTKIKIGTLSEVEYRKWISEADISIVAYNFDDSSKSYVRYSMANKLPELLASGSAVLAIGPPDIATLQFLSRHDLGFQVNEIGVEPIKRVLGGMLGEKQSLLTSGSEGQQFAFENLRISDVRDHFWQCIRAAARERDVVNVDNNRDYLNLLISSTDCQSVPELPAMTEKPPNPSKPRLKRIALFYASWRGVVAIIALAVASLPILASLVMQNWGSVLVRMGPVLALAVIFFFIGYIYTIIQDHFYTEKNI